MKMKKSFTPVLVILLMAVTTQSFAHEHHDDEDVKKEIRLLNLPCPCSMIQQ